MDNAGVAVTVHYQQASLHPLAQDISVVPGIAVGSEVTAKVAEGSVA